MEPYVVRGRLKGSTATTVAQRGGQSQGFTEYREVGMEPKASERGN